MSNAIRGRCAPQAWLAVVVLHVFAACGGSEQSAPVPSSLTVVSGSGQTAVVGTLLAEALVVEVRDDAGQPMAGFTVSWGVTAGGGSIGAASSSTGADGRASVSWTLGGTVGAQGVSASGGAGLSASFTATGSAAPATQIAISGETTLSALQATSQLTGQLQDAFGNPVAGDVNWSTSDAAVATVSTAGLLTSIANGTATITATSGNLTGTAEITVAQVAATLTIAPAAPVATVGGTVQLAAAGLDANGFDVTVTAPTWTSASTGIATVSASGLVTAVASGTSVITATSGAASGTVTMTVTDAPFEPSGDMTIDGDVAAERITIPTGVTVTLTAGATLSSATTLTVAGTIVGDCVPATLSAGTELTVSGTITTSCSDATRSGGDLVLRATGAINTSGARLTSGGSVTISNVPVAGLSARTLGFASSSRTGECWHVDLLTTAADGQEGAAGSPQGGDGAPGGAVSLLCAGDMTLEGGVLTPGTGGFGGAGNSLGGAPATGGRGGAGGLVRIAAPTMTIKRAQLASGLEAVKISLGIGGGGGQGTAVGNDPTATGGSGGDGTLPIIGTEAGTISLEGGVGFPALTFALFGGSGSQIGGNGGTGFATATDGEDATSDSPAATGNRAVAIGGKGGRNGGEARTDLIGDVLMGTVTNPGAISIQLLENARPGAGGPALATGGDGGDGSRQFKDGGRGGPSTHTGGEGGEMTFFDNRSNQYIGAGATGGALGLGNNEVFERPFGTGGNGFSFCGIGDIEAGGRGGDGGLAGGFSGQPSLANGVRQGDMGGLTMLGWGNGGNGGDGSGPGMGGAIGDFGAMTYMAPLEHLGLVRRLQPGTDGSPCAITVEPGISVASDANNHAPFIGYGGVSLLTVTPGADGALTITGNGPWVSMTGTVSADGSFTLTGSGTVAGYPGVGITMTGMLTLDEENRVIGIASSTLTVDATNSVLPPNGEGQRNPAIYSVTGSKIGGEQ